MDSGAVLQRNDAQVTTTHFGDRRPKSIAIILLPLRTERVLEDVNAPLSLQVRSFREHDALEVVTKIAG
jgi:hypothetical protein